MSKQLGPGPVAFRADGAPLQLIRKDHETLLLWDLAKQQAVRELKIPPPAAGRDEAVGLVDGHRSAALVGEPHRIAPKPSWWGSLRSTHPTEKDPYEPVLAMTPDSARIALAQMFTDRQGRVLVWDGASGELLTSLPTTASVLALTPDGSLLAAGDDQGQITLWGLSRFSRSENGTVPFAQGPTAPLATLSSGRAAIRSLAFDRDRHSPSPLSPGERAGVRGAEIPSPQSLITNPQSLIRWLLAAGDAGGTVTIWDVANRMPRSTCRGSHYDVYAVAFSPDGMTLASGGRAEPRLWDVVTGSLLLRLDSADTVASLAFSSDGQRLAVAVADGPGRVDLWELERGRGIGILRGLSSQVEKICFSRDGNLLAALSNAWEVAIWDLPARRLVRVLNVSQGAYADNAALAFSPDGRLFAFAAGHEASLWSVGGDDPPRAWPLPEGLVDVLAFAAADRLLLFRMEGADGRALSDVPRQPRVCPIRNLLGPGSVKPLAMIPDFHRHVYTAAAPPDGACFLIDGLGGIDGKQRLVKAFSADGKLLYEVPTQLSEEFGVMVMDPDGKTLAIATADRKGPSLLAMPGGEAIGSLELHPRAMSPGAGHWVAAYQPSLAIVGYGLYRSGVMEPLFALGSEPEIPSGAAAFSADGRLLVWGSTDGSVRVCEMREVERRLRKIGSGW